VTCVTGIVSGQVLRAPRSSAPAPAPDHRPSLFGDPRLLGNLSRTALVFDLGLAVLLAAIGVWATSAGLVPRVTWISLGFMIPALILRRVLPPAALALAWISTGAQLGSGLDVSFLQVGTVIVLFSAVAYGRRWVVVLAGASVIVGTVLAVSYLFSAQSWTWLFVPTSNRPIFTPTVVFALIPLGVLSGACLAGIASRLLRRSQQAQVAREAAEQEARRSEAIAVLEREKADLARDVHDVVGHSLAVIIAQSDSVRFLDDSDPEALRRTVATIAETARRSLGEVRGVLTQIEAAETNGIGVIPDLDQLLRNVSNSGATLSTTVDGDPVALSSRAADAAHRVLQEALTNALKFSDRDQPILVSRRWSPSSLEIRVRNHVTDGIRLPSVEADPTCGGSGITGMRARLDAVGGRLTVETGVERGKPVFTVLASIPVTSTRS